VFSFEGGGKWTQWKSMSMKRSGCAGTVWNGNLIVGGSASKQCPRTVECFDLSKHLWMKLRRTTKEHENPAIGVVDGHLHIGSTGIDEIQFEDERHVDIFVERWRPMWWLVVRYTPQATGGSRLDDFCSNTSSSLFFSVSVALLIYLAKFCDLQHLICPQTRCSSRWRHHFASRDRSRIIGVISSQLQEWHFYFPQYRSWQLRYRSWKRTLVLQVQNCKQKIIERFRRTRSRNRTQEEHGSRNCWRLLACVSWSWLQVLRWLWTRSHKVKCWPHELCKVLQTSTTMGLRNGICRKLITNWDRVATSSRSFEC